MLKYSTNTFQSLTPCSPMGKHGDSCAVNDQALVNHYRMCHFIYPAFTQSEYGDHHIFSWIDSSVFQKQTKKRRKHELLRQCEVHPF
jgi:hypothetical protein